MADTSGSNPSGSMLTVTSVDDLACRIADMWTKYNIERTQALKLSEEARQYIFATDIDQTSANILPHKNRTHQPKLTEISDKLQSKYFEASLSMQKFFKYDSANPDEADKAQKIETWVRAKLEQRKFRETVGRQLLTDYVLTGNCFVAVDYIIEKNNLGSVTYKGPDVRRVSPMDIVFNPRAQSFKKSPKIERMLVHVAEIANYADMYPNAGFKKEEIAKAIEVRRPEYVNEWVELIKERGINMDGYGSWSEYFKQDMLEVLVYRGDVFDPSTGKADQSRIVYIVDRTFVIRNEPSRSPSGYDGMHAAGWRARTDNLWAQGPLDNLVGMQYRCDHLENLKADVFDLIAHPVLLIKGDTVQEPSEGYRPGASYRMSSDEDVKFLVPDAAALNANNEIQLYHKMMDDFAGTPPETRGIRTPGEKTAFEVQSLSEGAAQMFIDKARIFERMLETMLTEIFELTLVNFSEADWIAVTNDETGATNLEKYIQDDFSAKGNFTAIGARFWERRNKQVTEIQSFITGVMADPRIRAHVSGVKLANYIESRMDFGDDSIIEPFAGVKEDVHIQAIAQSEAAAFKKAAGGPVAAGDASGTGTEVFQGPGGPQSPSKPSQGQ